MRWLFALLIFPTFERVVPHLMRMNAFEFLPWGDRARVDLFYAKYGWVSFPRTPLLIATIVAVSLNDFVSLDENTAVVIGLGALSLWLGCVFYDIWKAGKAD